MTLAKPNNHLSLIPGPMSRAMLRRGLEVDAEHMESIRDMESVTGPSHYADPNNDGRPGLFQLTRYSMDKDSQCFRMFDPEKEFAEQDSLEKLEGVVFFVDPHRQLREYPVYDPKIVNRILCASGDGIIGHGKPGGKCISCQYSKWPTKETQQAMRLAGRMAEARPRCEDRWYIFFKGLDAAIPSYLDLPGSQKYHLEKYASALSKDGAKPWQVVSVLQTRTVDNRPRIILEPVSLLDTRDAELVRIIEVQTAIMHHLVQEYVVWVTTERGGDMDEETTVSDLEQERPPEERRAAVYNPDGTVAAYEDELPEAQAPAREDPGELPPSRMELLRQRRQQKE